MRLLLSILVATFPAVSVLAQAGDELRGRAVGKIRNRNGEPWPGAEVVLLSRPLPVDPVPGMLLFTGKAGERMFHDSIQVGWKGESRDDFEWRVRH